MRILYWFGVIALLAGIVCCYILFTNAPKDWALLKTPDSIVPNITITEITDSQTEKLDPISLQQQLRNIVESRGYTWSDWNQNKIPRDIKWEITSENSKNILKLLKENE